MSHLNSSKKINVAVIGAGESARNLVNKLKINIKFDIFTSTGLGLFHKKEVKKLSELEPSNYDRIYIAIYDGNEVLKQFTIEKYNNLFWYNALTGNAFKIEKTSKFRSKTLSNQPIINEIVNFRHSDSKNIKIVYDIKVSPVAYGEVIKLLILSKLFSSETRSIEFIIITDETIKYQNSNDKRRLHEFLNITELLVKEEIMNIQFKHAPGFSFFQDYKNDRSDIFCASYIFNRVPIYCNLYNVFNDLESVGEIKKELLLFRSKPSRESHVTWSIRHSSYRTASNINHDQFFIIYNWLVENFASHEIIILTTQEGKEVVSKWIKHKKVFVRFSKPQSPNYWTDVQIALGSSLYIQVNGGGMALPLIHSEVPYIICCPLCNEEMFSDSKICSWQNRNQFFLPEFIDNDRLHKTLDFALKSIQPLT